MVKKFDSPQFVRLKKDTWCGKAGHVVQVSGRIATQMIEAGSAELSDGPAPKKQARRKVAKAEGKGIGAHIVE